jgi:hypothetical protein
MLHWEHYLGFGVFRFREVRRVVDLFGTGGPVFAPSMHYREAGV